VRFALPDADVTEGPTTAGARSLRDPLGWLRRICLALPGATEVGAWGHPNFRVAGRTFAVFEIYKGRPCIAVVADLDEQPALIDHFGFFKTPYIGRLGWVSAWVDEPAPFRLIGELVRRAHGSAAAAPRRARVAGGGTRPTRPRARRGSRRAV
jgi:predicted DNA-binding protein (MmcQ/YjbR family)